MDYRNSARDSLSRTKQALENGSEYYLQYASLELRMALEALIYERAGLYKDELPQKALSTWQPRKLLEKLLEIDPYTDQSSTIAIGIEEEYGKPSKEMKHFGKERVLSLSEIKKYYNRLGSYLHTQTIEQVGKGKGASSEKLRENCNELYKIINEVVSSPVFNFNIRKTTKCDCGRCGAVIPRRVVPIENTFNASCVVCGATYKITTENHEDYLWEPIGQKVKCANKSCDEEIFLFENEIKLGTNWLCAKCNKRTHIGLALVLVPEENNN
jgi:hypothetical protein